MLLPSYPGYILAIPKWQYPKSKTSRFINYRGGRMHYDDMSLSPYHSVELSTNRLYTKIPWQFPWWSLLFQCYLGGGGGGSFISGWSDIYDRSIKRRRSGWFDVDEDDDDGPGSEFRNEELGEIWGNIWFMLLGKNSQVSFSPDPGQDLNLRIPDK